MKKKHQEEWALLKSLTFSLIFYLWITIAMVLSLPFIFFYKIIYRLNHYFAKSVGVLLKYIVGIDYRIEGLEHLPIGKLETNNSTLNSQLSQLNSGFVIASKHQSAWETLIAFAFLPKVVFVYKKELGNIPIYGWYNKAYKNIKVDRGGGVAAVKSIISQAKNRVEKGHQVVIFPQGTRIPIGEKLPYKSAVYGMYKEGLPIYPAALNSGKFWPKKGRKKSGTIVWKFLPKIEQGLSKDEFMARLEAIIEGECERL